MSYTFQFKSNLALVEGHGSIGSSIVLQLELPILYEVRDSAINVGAFWFLAAPRPVIKTSPCHDSVTTLQEKSPLAPKSRDELVVCRLVVSLIVEQFVKS